MSNKDVIADIAAGGSVLTFLGLSLGQWNNIVHLVAGLVAIIAGGLAIAYHIRKIHNE